MEVGTKAHKNFRKHLHGKTLLNSLLPNNFYALPATAYYLNDDEFETKVFIHNYFSLLTDFEQARAKWLMDVYSKDGVPVTHTEGLFTGPKSVVVDIPSARATEFGVVSVKIELLDDTLVIDQPYNAVYYTELTRKSSAAPQKVIYHSLGTPVGSTYDYRRENYTSGSVLSKDLNPYFLYSNGSLVRLGDESSYASGVLHIVNSKGEVLDLALPEISEPMASRRLDVRKECPAFALHVGDAPFHFRISGKNILSKSFWYLTGPSAFLGEHF